MRFVLPFVAVALLCGVASGQAGLTRPNVGPGQGPRTDYHDQDWEYWWFLNSEPILARRLQERFGDAAKPTILSSIQLERASSALESALVETNSELRSAALLALAKIGNREVLPRLLSHLDDPSLEVRRSAAQALGVLGDIAATAPLVEVILDKKRESDVRRSAALALGLLAAYSAPATERAPQTSPGPEVPPMTPLYLRHVDGGVRSIAWSPDGRQIAAVGTDGSVHLFGTEGDDRVAYPPDPLGATRATFSPDGEQICVARLDGFRIWSLRAERELQEQSMPRPVADVAFDPERGERILVLTADATPQIWSVRSRRFVVTADREAAWSRGAWRKDADRIAIGTTDGHVSIAFPKSGRELAYAAVHDSPVIGIAWAADGESIISASRTGQVMRCDAAGNPLRSLHRFEGPLAAFDVHPDGRTVAAADAAGLWVVDAEDSTVIANVRLSADEIVSLSWAPDGTRLAVGTTGGDIRVYEPIAPKKSGTTGDDVVSAANPATEAIAQLLVPETFFELERTVQSGLAIASGVSGDPALAAPIEQLLNRKLTLDRIPRAYFILSLGRVIADERKVLLFEFIEDDDVHARRSAAIAIGRRFRGTADRDVMKRLAKRDQFESDVTAKNFGAISMGRVGSGQGPQPLLARIQDRKKGALTHNGVVIAPHFSLDAKSRLPFAALGLGLAQDQRGFEDLGRAFDDERDHSSRAAIAIAAGLFGDQRAARAVRSALKSERDPILAGYLALASGLLGDASAAELIEKLLDKAIDIELVPNAAIALRLLGSKNGQRILVERLEQEKRPGARAAVLYALGRTGNADAFDPVFDVLNDHGEPAAVRAYAAVALGDLAAGRAVRRWATILEDFNYPAEPELLNNFLESL